jgi:tol-pal system protein YbgF
MPAPILSSAPRARPLARACYVALLAIGITTMLTACEADSAQPDPTEVRLNDMDQRLGRVERVVSNQSLVQLSQHVDQLDQQVRELRGDIEELQNANDTLTKQQRDYYGDLDRRIGALEAARAGSGAATVPTAPGVPGAAAPAGGAGAAGVAPLPAGTPGQAAAAAGAVAGSGAQGADQGAYANAFNTLKSGNIGAAVAQFKQFLSDYPMSDLDDNAQYWLGEAYYVSRDYDNAAAAFHVVGDKYPQSRKAPDALLKLGYTELEQQKNAEGRATLQQVVQNYPTSDAAKLAAQRLSQLPQGSP